MMQAAEDGPRFDAPEGVNWSPRRRILVKGQPRSVSDEMPLWQRLLITLVTMLLVSVVAGFLWRSLFNTDIPSYLSGLVGGVTAVPMWEFLKWIDLR